MLAKTNQQETVEPFKQKGGSGKSKDDKDAKKHNGNMIGTVTELRKEVSKDVEQVLADNKFFDQKFEAMKMKVEEVKVEIRHESDRVIDTILAGPHERIDRVCDLHPVGIIALIDERNRTYTTSGRRWCVYPISSCGNRISLIS